jgi:hypothetical protein
MCMRCESRMSDCIRHNGSFKCRTGPVRRRLSLGTVTQEGDWSVYKVWAVGCVCSRGFRQHMWPALVFVGCAVGGDDALINCMHGCRELTRTPCLLPGFRQLILFQCRYAGRATRYINRRGPSSTSLFIQPYEPWTSTCRPSSPCRQTAFCRHTRTCPPLSRRLRH